MFAIPARDAPEKTAGIIGANSGKWVFMSVPTVLISLMTWLVWWVPLDDRNPVRFKTWITVGMVGFLLLFWAWGWLRVTLRYRKFKRQGHILEFRDRDVNRFRRSFWKLLDARVRAVQATESTRFSDALIQLHGLVTTGEEAGRQAARELIQAEEDRLKVLSAN